MSQKQQSRFKQVVLHHLLQVKRGLLLSALCMLGFTFTQLLGPWPLKIIFDHILLDRPLPSSLSFLEGMLQQGKVFALVMLSLSIVLIALLRGIFSYFQLYMTSRIGYQMVYALRRELFVHLQRLSLSFHNRARSGELLTKVTSDTNTLKDIFAESALDFTAHLLTLIGMFAIMVALNWQLSLIPLATFPVLFYALGYLYREIKASARSQRRKEGKIASRINEILTAVTLVQAFGRERYEQERFETESAQTLEESIRTARMEAAATRTVEILSAVGIWAVILFGSLQVLKGEMTPGDILIFASYLTNMYRPIRNLARLSTQFSKAMVSAERISEILEIEPEVQDDPHAVEAANLRGEIVFENVSFVYDPGNGVLKNVSFTISPGERVALTGSSGAGKSTIVSLILRFYDPQEGSISIDGVNIKNYQRESLRREVGVVLQDSILFGATIGENIAYGKPDATAEEIEEAARRAHIHDFIMDLPNSYDTVLGERGATLSGGQRQRICLARAIVKRPAILILDEPTSAVDAESEALIWNALEHLQPVRTTLIIAHQISTIKRCNRILVLKNGEIIEKPQSKESKRISS